MPRTETTDVRVTPLDLSIAKGRKIAGRVFEVGSDSIARIAALRDAT